MKSFSETGNTQTLFGSLYGRLLIPAYETGLKRRATFRYLRALEQSQWAGRGELEQIQLAALRRLLGHAASACPYYRAAWRERGLDPADVGSLADFGAWPVIDREAIRADRLRMRAVGHEHRLISKATGGSSGVPLAFDLDVGSDERRMAAWHRGYGWAGAGLGTKQLYLWGAALGGQTRRARWKDQLYARLYRRTMLNCFELSDERTREFLARLNRHRPEVIVAYTNPLYSFAQSLERRGLKPYSPRSIVIGAEKIHPFQRELIERVFDAPVFETYGSREFMLIGAECDRHAGLHLTMEHLLVEVFDDDGRPTPDGAEGNVVVTDLYNYGMPFIRYANGDRAIAGWGACGCGRGLPLVKKIVGRRLDLLSTPDGRSVPGEFFPHLMKEFPAVRRFQVVQDRLDHIELRVVLGESWSAADRELLEREVRAVVGDAVRFDVTSVDDIPLTPAGKLRVVINRCAESAESRAAAHV